MNKQNKRDFLFRFSDVPRRMITKYLIFAFLFVGLPLIVLLWLFDSFVAARQKETHNRFIENQHHIMGTLADGVDASFALEPTFKFLHQKFLRGKIGLNDWAKIAENIKKRDDINVDIYLYSSNGDLITPHSMNVKYRKIMDGLWRFLLYSDRSRIRSYGKILEGLLGDWNNLNSCMEPAVKFNVSVATREKAFFSGILSGFPIMAE